MPTYEYACRSCGEHLEAVQSFTDDALTVCPKCGGELRKHFGSVGIVFKGSGFYKTDSRSAQNATAPATTSDTAPPTPPSSDAPASTTPATTPAPAPAVTPATPATSLKSADS